MLVGGVAAHLLEPGKVGEPLPGHLAGRQWEDDPLVPFLLLTLLFDPILEQLRVDRVALLVHRSLPGDDGAIRKIVQVSEHLERVLCGLRRFRPCRLPGVGRHIVLAGRAVDIDWCRPAGVLVDRFAAQSEHLSGKGGGVDLDLRSKGDVVTVTMSRGRRGVPSSRSSASTSIGRGAVSSRIPKALNRGSPPWSRRLQLPQLPDKLDFGQSRSGTSRLPDPSGSCFVVTRWANGISRRHARISSATSSTIRANGGCASCLRRPRPT